MGEWGQSGEDEEERIASGELIRTKQAIKQLLKVSEFTNKPHEHHTDRGQGLRSWANIKSCSYMSCQEINFAFCAT